MALLLGNDLESMERPIYSVGEHEYHRPSTSTAYIKVDTMNQHPHQRHGRDSVQGHRLRRQNHLQPVHMAFVDGGVVDSMNVVNMEDHTQNQRHSPHQQVQDQHQLIQHNQAQFEPYSIAKHAETLLTYFQQLCKRGCFLEIRLESGGQFVAKAHKLIVAAFSEKLKTVLLGAVNPSTTIDIDPAITGVAASELLAIVDFMYTGRCIPSESLKIAAIFLGCTSLVNFMTSTVWIPGKEIFDSQHATNLLYRLQSFKEENLFLDCKILTVKMGEILCHRLVLCAYSRNFEAALLATAKSAHVTLNIDSYAMSVSGLDIKNVVDFVYLGILRGARRRFRLLRVSASNLGLTALVELIDANLYNAAVEEAANGYAEEQQQQEQGYVEFQVTEDNEQQEMIEENEYMEEPVHHHQSYNDYDGLNAMSSNDIAAQAADDYISIYEEYVLGPRRGRRGGTYGMNKAQPLTIKGPPVLMDAPGDPDLDSMPAVTMSYTPGGGRKRKRLDSFGYGLPEVIGTNDVQVPLLVGDQQILMERPFKCKYCDHRTKEKSCLLKHIRCKHTGEAPYCCHLCTQTFKVQSNLVRHIRAHTGEKPYVCKKCGICYADKKNMDAHVYREHLKTRMLECPEPGCNARFWRHDRFAKHCEKMHGTVALFQQ